MKRVILVVALAVLSMALPAAAVEAPFAGRSSSFAALYPPDGGQPGNAGRLSDYMELTEEELEERIGGYQEWTTPLWGAIYRGSIDALGEDGSAFDIEYNWSETGEAEAEAQFERLSEAGRDSYFGDQAVRVRETASLGADIGAFAVTVSNYAAEMGDGAVTVELPPGYGAVTEAPVAMVIGLKGGDGRYCWRVFEAKPAGPDSVEGMLDRATLLDMQRGDAILFILQ